MDSFLDDLEFFCTASLMPPTAPEYQAAREEYCTMETQIKDAMGAEFLEQFTELNCQIRHWEALQTFQAGLRFGADFAHTVWVNPPRSRHHSGSTRL